MEDNLDEKKLFSIPLSALRPTTRLTIVNALNKRRVLPSEEGLPRDYRGLADLTALPIPPGDNPTKQLLIAWERDPGSSLGQLENFLGRLDRWDIVDDVYDAIREDAKAFDSMIKQVEDSSGKVQPGTESENLTYDDLARVQQGLPLKTYDALLLYADQDQEFANQILDELKNNNLQVCNREDLIAGYMFEQRGYMQLIAKRCRHVVAILSQHFINNNSNKFLVSFAHSVAIENGRRIIIPCIYEKNLKNLPIELSNVFKLDYTRNNLKDYNFWDRLKRSIADSEGTQALATGSDVETPPVTRRSQVKITEIDSSTELANIQAYRTKISNKSTTNLAILPVPSHTSSMTSISPDLTAKKTKSRSPMEFIRKLVFKTAKSKRKTKNITDKCNDRVSVAVMN